MLQEALDEEFDLDDEFDPLEVSDEDIDQEEMEDENPYDTVDYPTMRNMPETMRRDAVYSPARQGSARNAILELIDHNPARRPVLLGIIGFCGLEGKPASAVTEEVERLQKDNRSVYEPMTLCRMLERAGAMELEMPEVSEEKEDVEAGVEYLEIKEQVDPVWHATEVGLEIRDELTQGAAFREVILDHDRKYLEVYRAVMELLVEGPRSKNEIEELVDTFEIVKNPRRFGGHFIDMLERTDAIEWKDRSWQITDLGRTLLPQMGEQEGEE